MYRDKDHTVIVLHSSVNDLQQPGVAVVLQLGDSGLEEVRYPFLPPAPANPLSSSLLIDVNTHLLAQRAINNVGTRKYQKIS